MEYFDTGFAYIAGRFARVEPQRRARAYLLGLLADVETRSCWQLAEHAGDASPHGMQRLLSEAVWDADAVRDDLRSYVADQLGHPGGVLIIDDTGGLRKGVHSVVCSATTPAPPGGSRTRRSACSWDMPPRPGTR